MNNRYSKFRVASTTKSRSIDFSDLLSFPPNPKSITISSHSPSSKTQQTKQTSDLDTSNSNTHCSFSEQEHEDGVGESFGAILSRSCAVSSASSRRSTDEKQNTTLKNAMRRAFSMRKPSSVSEGYSRIHDQCNPLFSPTDDDGLTTMQTRSKKRKGKILRACKRLFGL